MIANSPRTITDISQEDTRALAFSIWSIGPINGPVTGPLIGGFVYQYLGWRWTNWLVLILAGSGFLLLLWTPETYAPKILRDKVLTKRRQTGDDRWWCRYDDPLSIASMLKVSLPRPFSLTFREPILWFWDLYVGAFYAILYLCFVAYPLVFSENRGWNPGMSGLAFIGVGFGNIVAICSEPLVRHIVSLHSKDAKTGHVQPEATLCIVCVGAVLVPIGQLWFAWTCIPNTIHWIWPILAGIPFGAGQSATFIYVSNYIAGAYGIYAASALAGNGVIRCVLAGVLPLAGPTMYSSLTLRYAGTLMGGLEVLLAPIPFIFYFWGGRIREQSQLIRRMRADQERMESANKA